MRSCLSRITALTAFLSLLLLQPYLSIADDKTVDLVALQEAYHRIWSLVSYTYPANKMTKIKATWEKYEHKYDGKLHSVSDLSSAASGLLSILQDPRVHVLTPSEADAYQCRTESGSMGVGLSFTAVQLLKDGLRITKVEKESTADDAGLLVNDIITAVDDINLQSWTTHDALYRLIAGDSDTAVKFTILRNGKKKDVGVVRDVDGSIGIEVEAKNPLSLFKVDSVYKDSLAEQAGVEPEDIVFSINEHSVNGLSPREFRSELLNGHIGTPIIMQVLRSHEPVTVKMTLGIVKAPVYSLRLSSRREYGYGNTGEDGVSHIELENLDWSNVAYEAEHNLIENANRYPNIILDLRGCSGNNVYAAAEFASLFIKNGQILQCIEEEQGHKITKTFYMSNSTLMCRMKFQDDKNVTEGVENVFTPHNQSLNSKLVVLIDDKTSGAAEALAYALQKNDRAPVVGFKSAGNTVLTHTYEYLIDNSNGYVYVQVPKETLVDEKGQPAGPVYPDRLVLLRGSLLNSAENELNGTSMYNNLNVYGPSGLALFLFAFAVYFVWHTRKQKIAPITSMTFPPAQGGPSS